jgi:hypothetical protein
MTDIRPDITLRAENHQEFCFQPHSRFGAAFLDYAFAQIDRDLTWDDAADIVTSAKAEGLVVRTLGVRGNTVRFVVWG